MGRERAEVWAERIARWRESGLSTREFAARENLKSSTLGYWKWKLDCEARARAGSVKFVEVIGVAAAGSETAAPFELVCAGGRLVRVPASFDAGALGRLLDVVERR
jgi:transposase